MLQFIFIKQQQFDEIIVTYVGTFIYSQTIQDIFNSDNNLTTFIKYVNLFYNACQHFYIRI